MKTIWIFGAGRFGLKAAESLSSHADILLIDKDISACHRAEQQGFETVCSDAADYLDNFMKKNDTPDYIIPSVPIHLAYQWIRQKISIRAMDIPSRILARIPNPMTGKNREMYMSYANFICPDNCPEPADICTYTRQPRKGTLYKLAESLSSDDFTSVVVRSRQLAPGVGGYMPQALSDALESVRNSETPVLLSTACRCHGVMHAFGVEGSKT